MDEAVCTLYTGLKPCLDERDLKTPHGGVNFKP
jgi:hypothetical protein